MSKYTSPVLLQESNQDLIPFIAYLSKTPDNVCQNDKIEIVYFLSVKTRSSRRTSYHVFFAISFIMTKLLALQIIYSQTMLNSVVLCSIYFFKFIDNFWVSPAVTLHSNIDDVTSIDSRKRVITLFLFVTLINQVINYTVSIRTGRFFVRLESMFTKSG